jgi:hypothetical protein
LDAARIWALNSNRKSFNSGGAWELDSDGHGFRINPRDTFAPTDRTFRIFLVGDSFTFGHYVRGHETMPAYLQERLRKDGYDVQVVNAGVCGYSPGQEYIHIQDVVQSLQPGLIVWNFDYGDWGEMQGRSMHWIFRKKLLREPAALNGLYLQGLIQRVFRGAVMSSRALNFTVNALVRFDAVRLTEKASDDRSLRKIDAMIRRVRADNEGKLLAGETPSFWLLNGAEPYDDFRSSTARQFLDGVKGLSPDWIASNAVFRKRLAAGKIRLDDLFLDLELDPDKHLTPAGNRLYAEVLADHLESNGYARMLPRIDEMKDKRS